MATKKSSSKALASADRRTSEDAWRALVLAQELNRWAVRIDAPDTSPAERARLAAKVHILDAEWRGLGGRRALDRDSRAAAFIARVCRDVAMNARAWRNHGHCLDEEPLDRATRMALGLLSEYLPDHAKAFSAHKGALRALVQAHMANRGGRGRTAEISTDSALANLLGAMRMRVEPSSVKRSAARRKTARQ